MEVTNGTKLDETLCLLGVRDRMSNFAYFVGRDEDVDQLLPCIGGEQRTCVWLHGPRRIGKSSLASYFGQRNEDEGGLTIWVDAGDLGQQDFDALLGRVVVQLDRSSPVEGETIRERIERAVAPDQERRLLIVFDEMDRLAISLRTHEQAFLRRLSSDNPRLAFFFITRTAPSALVEEVPEVSSRLLGICVQHKLGILAPSAINELLRRVEERSGCAGCHAWFDVLWGTVGGHPLAVMSLTHALLAAARRSSCEDVDPDDVFERRQVEVDQWMDDLWTEIHPATRVLVLDDADEPSDRKQRIHAISDGFYSRRHGVIRPAEFLAAAERLGCSAVSPSAAFAADDSSQRYPEHLLALMYAINQRLRLRGLAAAFQATDEVYRYYVIARPVGSEEELAIVVNHLNKICIEAVKTRDDPPVWRLPAPLDTTYRTSKPIKAVGELRNFFDHDPNQGKEGDSLTVRSGRHKRVGKVFDRLCGRPTPSAAADWGAIRNQLCRELIEVLIEIERNAGA